MRELTNKLLYIFTTLIFVLIIYNISSILIDFGMISIGRRFFLIIMTLFLFIPYFKNNKKRNEIIREGLLGEEKLQNEINKLDINENKIISNVILKNKRSKKEFDNLIITEKGIYNIKCTNIRGDIVIEKDGILKRYYNNQYNTVDSPIKEIQRESLFLKEIIEDINIMPILVITNKFVSITGKGNSKIAILTIDEINEYIVKDNLPTRYNKEELYNRVKKNIKEYSNIFSLRSKYDEFNYYSFEYKTKISISSFFILFYLLNLI
ncbi:nuclease-related domain-containing protein [Clostridium chauvoei]|uniref:NERD domain-containing protein n=2 Tax=Clostridium chauvoei TaxID=46867 RepID=A0ABD4RE05_9CLOT|nr:nuclease-related domain-containing protein [Clostridium chauvoei]ATD55106.1 hypothetical protein BTM20_07580 [Clostridium chauvoei]ATD57220.1 hypothetical protein BTM21_05475 [Clostridium chauvoei]MBX7279451.1 NERD domain-containing protein [Clostridium chauvoei]MBX7282463.1 NERD domain-containing protein [Clostridium chauvoei]MBX7285650.1 NERD domain-containing protein [Clostridium chauvoei]